MTHLEFKQFKRFCLICGDPYKTYLESARACDDCLKEEYDQEDDQEKAEEQEANRRELEESNSTSSQFVLSEAEFFQSIS